MKALREYFSKNKSVAPWVERRNSGGMPGSYKRKDGITRTSFTWFQETWAGDGKVLDLEGMTWDGRVWGIEVKPGDWTKPTDERERQQAKRINLINSCGGHAMFLTSAEQIHSFFEGAAKRWRSTG